MERLAWQVEEPGVQVEGLSEDSLLDEVVVVMAVCDGGPHGSGREVLGVPVEMPRAFWAWTWASSALVIAAREEAAAGAAERCVGIGGRDAGGSGAGRKLAVAKGRSIVIMKGIGGCISGGYERRERGRIESLAGSRRKRFVFSTCSPLVEMTGTRYEIC